MPPPAKVAYNKGEKGFTLAEVLVTLGIIGVVSAMTVPSLMQNHQRKTYVTQLHKVYNELSQAAVQYQTDNNAVNLKEAGLIDQASADKFIENYFKIVQKCGSDKTPCFANKYRKLNGAILTAWYPTGTHYAIANGTSIKVNYRAGQNNMLVEFYVDTNGAKGPNIVGRDLFAMFLYNDGLIDDYDFKPVTNAPMTEDEREANFATCNGTGTNWHGCFGKILNDNWEMTY